MTAYVIVEVSVHDPVRYEDYKRMSRPAVEACGGRFIVRGGAVTTLEGDWDPQRIVILEFPDVAAAKAWHESDVYREARDLRHATATSRMIVVEGVA
jgi:uncharacterized protein (DUF1330 family)